MALELDDGSGEVLSPLEVTYRKQCDLEAQCTFSVVRVRASYTYAAMFRAAGHRHSALFLRAPDLTPSVFAHMQRLPGCPRSANPTLPGLGSRPATGRFVLRRLTSMYVGGDGAPAGARRSHLCPRRVAMPQRFAGSSVSAKVDAIVAAIVAADVDVVLLQQVSSGSRRNRARRRWHKCGMHGRR